MKRGRRNASASRRDALLRAAARLMRERGYARASTRQIAAAVGMEAGSPYCHFRDKEALLFAIAETGLQMALARAEYIIGEIAEPEERLRRLIEAHVDCLHGADGDFVAVLLREWPQLSPPRRQRLRESMRQYEAIWMNAWQAVSGSGDDHAFAVKLLLGGLNWSLFWFRPDGKKPANTLAGAAARLAVCHRKAAVEGHNRLPSSR